MKWEGTLPVNDAVELIMLISGTIYKGEMLTCEFVRLDARLCNFTVTTHLVIHTELLCHGEPYYMYRYTNMQAVADCYGLVETE